MKLRRIINVNNCLNKLLEEKLKAGTSFKLIKSKKDLEPYVDSAVESLSRYAKEIEDKPEDERKKLLAEEEAEILSEEVEFEFTPSLNLEDLPEIEGYIIEGIIPLIKEEN